MESFATSVQPGQQVVPWTHPHHNNGQSNHIPRQYSNQSVMPTLRHPNMASAMMRAMPTQDVRPRLTREQHLVLEAHFNNQNKPSTAFKKQIAEGMHVPLDKINNWFQNRRAKVKQENKKAQNERNSLLGQFYPPPYAVVIPADSGAQNTTLPSTDFSVQPVISQDHSNDAGHSHIYPQAPFIQSVSTIMESMQPGSEQAIMDNLKASGYPVQEPLVISDTGPNFGNGLYLEQPNFQPQHGTDMNYTHSAFQEFAAFEDEPIFNEPDYQYTYMNASASSGSISPGMLTPEGSIAELPQNQGPIEVNTVVPTYPQTTHTGNPGSEHDTEPADIDNKARSDSPQDQVRRNSSTTALAESMSTVEIHKPSDSNMRQMSQPSSFAARRQRPRPAAIGTGAPRSSSYSTGMPASPGNRPTTDQALRRIKSSGLGNTSRVQKAMNSPSGQRSPMNVSFAESALRNGSALPSPCVMTVGGNLAPPTPLTGDFRASQHNPWQDYGIAKHYGSTNTDGVAVSYAADNSHLLSWASPPSTPFETEHMANMRQTMMQNLHFSPPPQSAPATQQTFPAAHVMPQFTTMSHAMGHEEVQLQERRLSMSNIQGFTESNLHYPPVPAFSEGLQPNDNYQLGFSPYAGMQQDVPSASEPSTPFSPSSSQGALVKADFPVHEYTPPTAINPPAQSNVKTEETPKQYEFHHHDPNDFARS